MSPEQIRERNLIVDSLLAAGWRAPSNENEMFDQGLSVMREAVLEYASPEVLLGMFYRAEQSALYLSLDMSDDSSVELKLGVDARLREVLRVITSFQDRMTLANYREHVRSLMAVCDDLHVMVEGEKFVRLSDKKE